MEITGDGALDIVFVHKEKTVVTHSKIFYYLVCLEKNQGQLDWAQSWRKEIEEHDFKDCHLISDVDGYNSLEIIVVPDKRDAQHRHEALLGYESDGSEIWGNRMLATPRYSGEKSGTPYIGYINGERVVDIAMATKDVVDVWACNYVAGEVQDPSLGWS